MRPICELDAMFKLKTAPVEVTLISSPIKLGRVLAALLQRSENEG
jgi:hypothetical protein